MTFHLVRWYALLANIFFENTYCTLIDPNHKKTWCGTPIYCFSRTYYSSTTNYFSSTIGSIQPTTSSGFVNTGTLCFLA